MSINNISSSFKHKNFINSNSSIITPTDGYYISKFGITYNGFPNGLPFVLNVTIKEDQNKEKTFTLGKTGIFELHNVKIYSITFTPQNSNNFEWDKLYVEYLQIENEST